MKVTRENTSRMDRVYRDNPFAKSYRMKMAANDFTRRHGKVEALKDKKK